MILDSTIGPFWSLLFLSYYSLNRHKVLVAVVNQSVFVVDTPGPAGFGCSGLSISNTS